MLFPLDHGFDDGQFENIFLHNRYPGDKKNGKLSKKSTAAAIGDKAELWALYDGPARYHGLNMLRRLRALWGIHTTLQVGPRSVANAAVRGICELPIAKKSKHKIFFEGYKGNISDATRSLVTMAPYDHADKSRALSQKYFIRIVVPLKGLTPLEKIDGLLLAYAIAEAMDAQRFAGIVDPDIFLFVPPQSVRAGIAHYHREDRLLNTHLLSGFNFFEDNTEARFFTHGLGRFGMADLFISGKNLKSDSYAAALKLAHGYFLNQLKGNKQKVQIVQAKQLKLPEQVRAMVGKAVAKLSIGSQA